MVPAGVRTPDPFLNTHTPNHLSYTQVARTSFHDSKKVIPFSLEKITVKKFFADVGRIGIGICYDLRFQELAMIYAARGWPFIYSFSILQLTSEILCFSWETEFLLKLLNLTA